MIIRLIVLPKNLMLIFFGILCGLMQSVFNLPYLAPFCFAPMMYSLIHAKGQLEFLGGFTLFFIPYYLTQICFLVTVYKLIGINAFAAILLMAAATLLLTLWESFLMLMPVYLFLWLKRIAVLDIFSLAFLITGGEWLSEKIFILSFPWSGVWLTVTDSPLLMQGANLLGARFVSFLILSVGGLAAEAIMSKRRIVPLCLLAAICVFIISYGNYSTARCEEISSDGLTLTAVCAQDDAEGDKKNQMSAQEAADAYARIIYENLSASPDIILLPETAIPCDYTDTSEEFSVISDIAGHYGCAVISGGFISLDKEYNAMIAFTPDSVSTPYCKQRLIPFGETNPFSFLAGKASLSPCKDKQCTLPLNILGSGLSEDFPSCVKIGCAVCIESIYPSIVKGQTESLAQLICISTNDSWFGSTYARNQHYRHSIMRAVENSRWVLRSGNCGISAIISPSGEVVSKLEDKSEGVISADVSLIEENSFYTISGDIFAIFPALLAVMAIIRRYRLSS